ncbi:MAG: 30S ribosomal protein S17 [Alphaproteobacteria bacterium]|nr:MAG: 30S ribosomal protein S17 [Alphaproteobacteria bacterium]
MPKRILTGEVVSKSGSKTVKVKVTRRVPHPKYKKIVTLTKNYAAHDEKNQFNVGDKVRIQECRPLSATKRWEVLTAA